MASSEILTLVQIELSNARNMAEHADDGFLLYLIDMAILEVKRKSCSGERGSQSIPSTAVPQNTNEDSSNAKTAANMAAARSDADREPSDVRRQYWEHSNCG